MWRLMTLTSQHDAAGLMAQDWLGPSPTKDVLKVLDLEGKWGRRAGRLGTEWSIHFLE